MAITWETPGKQLKRMKKNDIKPWKGTYSGPHVDCDVIANEEEEEFIVTLVVQKNNNKKNK